MPATSTLLHEAFVRGDLDEVRRLLGDPEGFPNGVTPEWLGDVLTYAVYWSSLETVRALLELGADPNVDEGDGFPPLIAAFDRRADDRVDVMRLLIRHGAALDVHGMNDGTPLHHAVWHDNIEAARLLIAAGADPHAETRIDDYRSALGDAEASGREAIAAVLRGDERASGDRGRRSR